MLLSVRGCGSKKAGDMVRGSAAYDTVLFRSLELEKEIALRKLLNRQKDEQARTLHALQEQLETLTANRDSGFCGMSVAACNMQTHGTCVYDFTSLVELLLVMSKC